MRGVSGKERPQGFFKKQKIERGAFNFYKGCKAWKNLSKSF